MTHQKKTHYCGIFVDEKEAAEAVNSKCVELGIPLKNPEVGLLEKKLKPVTLCLIFFIQVLQY